MVFGVGISKGLEENKKNLGFVMIIYIYVYVKYFWGIIRSNKVEGMEFGG